MDAIEDVLPNIALSLPHLTNLTLGNVRPELAASFFLSLGESENPAALYNLTLSLINYRPDDKLAKTINPFKHTLHIINCCTQPSGRLWLDDERKVTRIPGIVLNGGRKTDHFRPSQRYPIIDATKESSVIRRIAKYARSLQDTLEFGHRHFERLAEDGNHVELEKGFAVLEKLRIWQRLV